MCLAIAGEVVKIDGDRATVDFGGALKDVSCALMPDVKLGEWVMVHTGFIIQRTTAEEARETAEIFKLLEETAREG